MIYSSSFIDAFKSFLIFYIEVNDVEETVAKLRRRIPMETRMTQPTETIKKRRIDFSSPTAEMTVRTPISKKRKSNKLDN